MKDLPNKRSDALELGETNYYTGKLCKRQHRDIRNAKTGRCLSCQREDARGDKQRPYHKTEEWKEYQRNYHREYAQTEHGKAVKQRAYERWAAKRRAEREAEKANAKTDSKSKRG
jgi:hypothetical protein